MGAAKVAINNIAKTAPGIKSDGLHPRAAIVQCVAVYTFG